MRSATSRHVLSSLIAAVALVLTATISHARPPLADHQPTAKRTVVLPDHDNVVRARAAARARDGLVSFATVDTRGRLRGFAVHRKYRCASVVKAMLLVTYLNRHAYRHQKLTAAERSTLHAMITVSDNEAANRIYSTVGDRGMRRVARRASMTDFVAGGYWASAWISAGDQAKLFWRIDKLVHRKYRAYARRLLSSVVAWQRWGVPDASRSRGFKLMFKGGWRGTPLGQLTHQAALLERGDQRISIAVLTDGNPSQGYGQETIRGVAQRLLKR